MLAPSNVPIVSAPLSMNFMLPVPLASVPAVLILKKAINFIKPIKNVWGFIPVPRGQPLV